MKLNSFLLTLSAAALFTGISPAAIVSFVPPNDTTGSVFSTNDNDNYDLGRGLVFRSNSAQTIDSIGIYLDVTNTLLNWVIYQTAGVTGDLSLGQVTLDSGSLTANTTGLAWVDIAIAPLTLAANGTYHLQFSHTAAANQNFYYNNDNIVWSQGAFLALDGTANSSTANSVVSAIRLNVVDSPASGVPEPSTLWMAAGAFALVLGRRRVRY